MEARGGLKQRVGVQSIQVGCVELGLAGPTAKWNLACRRCPWTIDAQGFTEAREFAEGHDITHRPLRRLWDTWRGTWLRWRP